MYHRGGDGGPTIDGPREVAARRPQTPRGLPPRNAGRPRAPARGRDPKGAHPGPLVREGRPGAPAGLRRGDGAPVRLHRAGAWRPHPLVREHGVRRPLQRPHRRAAAPARPARIAPPDAAYARRSRPAIPALAGGVAARPRARLSGDGVAARAGLEPRARSRRRDQGVVDPTADGQQTRAVDARRSEVTMDRARRDFLTGTAGLIATIAAGGCAAVTGPSASAATRRTPMFAYVGCYTSKERNGRGEGIGVYRIDPGAGDWAQVQLGGDIVKPSWLALDRRQRFLYGAHGDGADATAFAVDPESGR